MTKAKYAKFLAGIISAVILIFQFTFFAYAKSTADAKELIDPSRQCSLSLHYQSDKVFYEGMEIELYKIAAVSNDFKYKLTGDFSGYSIEVNGVSAQSEWKSLATTVGSYINADDLNASSTEITDKNGVASFENLTTGLYFVRWSRNAVPGNIDGFDSFIISLPVLGEDGLWIYDAESYPKAGGNVDEPTEDYLRVIKQWKDHSDKDRPEYVDVEIYCDGNLYESLKLTAENNWMFTWKVNGEHNWNVVERAVSEKYTVTVEQKETDFIITNTVKETPPPPVPKTGDNSHIELYLILMVISGIVLVVFGICGSKRKKA